MNYVMDLRKKIGHDPIIMVAAGVLLLNENNELLLQRRVDNGFWGYPGGAMELGESFEECAIREVFEETGLICKDLEVFEVESGSDCHYIYPNGDEVYIVSTIYVCQKYTGELKVDCDEATEQKFFSLNHLPDNLSPMQIKSIEKLCLRYA